MNGLLQLGAQPPGQPVPHRKVLDPRLADVVGPTADQHPAPRAGVLVAVLHHQHPAALVRDSRTRHDPEPGHVLGIAQLYRPHRPAGIHPGNFPGRAGLTEPGACPH